MATLEEAAYLDGLCGLATDSPWVPCMFMPGTLERGIDTLQ